MASRALPLAVLVLAVLGSYGGLHAQEPSPPEGAVAWRADPGPASRAAAAEGRLVLVYLFAKDCEHCKRFEAQTLADVGVRALLAKFVCLKLDARPSMAAPEKAEVVDGLVRKIRASGEKIRGVPAVVIADAGFEPVAFFEGFRDAAGFVARVEPVVRALERFQAASPAVDKGEAGVEDLWSYMEACEVLKKVGALRAAGATLLALERGPRHAEAACLLARSYDPTEGAFAAHKTLALEWDPDNAKGCHDALAVHEAVRLVRGVRAQAEKAGKVAQARALLAARLGGKGPALHPVRGQTLCWVQFQLLLEQPPRDAKAAKEALHRGVDLDPDSELGRTMAARLEELG